MCSKREFSFAVHLTNHQQSGSWDWYVVQTDANDCPEAFVDNGSSACFQDALADLRSVLHGSVVFTSTLMDASESSGVHPDQEVLW